MASKELCCDICFEEFNDKILRPRILTCGHTFCSCCISEFMKNRKVCPTCQGVIGYKDIESVPVNYFILSLMNKDEPRNKRNKLALPENGTQQLVTEGVCSIHQCPNQFVYITCNLIICGSCAMLNHINCNTEVIQEARKTILKNNKDIDMKVKNINKINTERNKYIANLHEIEIQSSSCIVDERVSLKTRQNLLTSLENCKRDFDDSKTTTELLSTSDNYRQLLETRDMKAVDGMFYMDEMMLVKIGTRIVIPTDKDVIEFLKSKNIQYCRINPKAFCQKVCKHMFNFSKVAAYVA